MPTTDAPPRSTSSSDDGWLPKPRHRPRSSRRPRPFLPTHPLALAKVARKRAQQRWSALLSRIGEVVRPALGDVLWADFVAHAEARYKETFVAAFRKPVLRCVGTNHGAPCPLAFEVDLTTPRTFVALEHLHLDHEQDVAITCDMWVRAIAALPHGPNSWSHSVDGALLCHLLFGVRADAVHGAAMLRFRCRAVPCHKLNMPHYRGLRDVAV